MAKGSYLYSILFRERSQQVMNFILYPLLLCKSVI